MMKVTAIYLILLGLTGRACAQKKQVFTIPDQELMSISQDPKKLNSDIRLPIIKGIGSNMDTGELMKVRKDAGHILSIGVSFNKDGAVDAVYFSKSLSQEISRILKPGVSMTKKIRDNVKHSDEYKNKVVIFPFFLFDVQSTNLIGHNLGSIKELTGMWPELNPNDKGKAVVLLDPYLNGFHRAVE